MERPSTPELTLLIVEDETLIAMELEDILRDLGHQVFDVCATAARAIALIDRSAGSLDGAILDANLGSLSAVGVAEALERHGVPFLLASGYNRDELERLGFHAPQIRKPYHRREIEHALATLATRTRR